MQEENKEIVWEFVSISPDHRYWNDVMKGVRLEQAQYSKDIERKYVNINLKTRNRFGEIIVEPIKIVIDFIDENNSSFIVLKKVEKSVETDN